MGHRKFRYKNILHVWPQMRLYYLKPNKKDISAYEIIGPFKNWNELADHLGVSPAAVTRHLHGTRKTLKGVHAFYADPEKLDDYVKFATGWYLCNTINMPEYVRTKMARIQRDEL